MKNYIPIAGRKTAPPTLTKPLKLFICRVRRVLMFKTPGNFHPRRTAAGVVRHRWMHSDYRICGSLSPMRRTAENTRSWKDKSLYQEMETGHRWRDLTRFICRGLKGYFADSFYKYFLCGLGSWMTLVFDIKVRYKRHPILVFRDSSRKRK